MNHPTARFVLSLAILLPVLVVATAGGGPAQAAVDRPVLLGLATHWESIPEDVGAIDEVVGMPPALYQAFWDLSGTDLDAGLRSSLDLYSSLGMTPYLEILTDDLAGLVAGTQDGKLEQFTRVIGEWSEAGADRRVLIAPLPEANLTEHPWGGDPTGYQAGYEKIRDAFLDAGLGPDRARFVFAMNGLSATGFSYPQFYPGDGIVDVVAFSKLNRGGSNWRDYETTFEMHIREMQDQVTRMKPILISQTGSVESNGQRADWLADMFGNLLDEGQVIGAIYFNRDKDVDFRVVDSGTVDPAFAAGYATWSHPSEASWFFDGRLDTWVADRASELVFDDIGGSIFADDILWVAENGISLGCGQYLYCPDDAVTRAQMASFLARALELPESALDRFIDDDGSAHEANIDAVANAGITLGCGAELYCPDDAVTRAQMASFLARALGLSESGQDWFVDDDGLAHEASINAVASAEITLGCGSGVYCPAEAVTRGQMAAFLRRALD